uniref:Ig-like domain-containing protein n=1 Tax=Chelydra serpentina TaxID=8475 RepID=A0A8C3SE13_CHESE
QCPSAMYIADVKNLESPPDNNGVKAVMAVGGALTIQCKCRCQGMRVVLYKGGGPTPLRYMDNAGDVVEFPISNVTLNDVGSYTCRSGSTSAPSIWSDPSDPIELVMRGEGPSSASSLPTPHPSPAITGSMPQGEAQRQVLSWGSAEEMPS